MVIYLIGIVGGDIAILICNLLFARNSFPELTTTYIVIASIMAAVGVIAIDGIFATLVRRCLPEKWFDYTVTFHDASKKECKFYEKIGIKKWKDHILELGMFTNFSKKNIQNPTVEYLERFILENNYGYWCHLLDAVFGFLLIFCYPLKYIYLFALPACIINFVLNMLPFMILRYNNNRLKRTRVVMVKKEERAKASAEKIETPSETAE